MANQPVEPENDPEPRRGGGNRGLAQAYEFRDMAAEEAHKLRDVVATSLDDKLSQAQALRCLAVVWKDASDRIRILRGRPLPGSKRPPVELRKPKKQIAPQGPSENPLAD